MTNTLRIKRRVSGSAGAPASLKSAELAYNMADDTIYAGYGDDGSGNATSIKPVGGEGTFAKLSSPTFTGTPAAPTATGGTNTTQIATTQFVQSAISGFGTGTVTSVGLSMPTAIFDVANSPVTSSGTLTVTLDTQTANTVFAGPSNGAAAAPTFRALVSGDIPDLSSTYLPLTGGTISSNLTVTGDLTVNGTTTTVNSTTVDVRDKNITLGNVAVPTDTTADGGGISLKGATDKTLNWVDSTDAWTSSEHIDLASGKSYYINGSAVLSASTLGSGVTSSSLTSVGTLTGGTWNATTISVGYGGTGLTSAAKGSVLVANSANTLSALDGGGSADAVLSYDAASDTISWSNTIDGGTF